MAITQVHSPLDTIPAYEHAKSQMFSLFIFLKVLSNSVDRKILCNLVRGNLQFLFNSFGANIYIFHFRNINGFDYELPPQVLAAHSQIENIYRIYVGRIRHFL